jgi:hypothetical protein
MNLNLRPLPELGPAPDPRCAPHSPQVLEEELLSLDGLSAKIAHAIRTRTVAAATGANADVPRAWSSPARPRPGAALAEALATAPSPESRGVAAIHRITRQVRACTTALSPSATSPPRSNASPYSMPCSPSSPSPARSLRLAPQRCDTLPESPQLRRVLDEMGVLEVEQKHMQQQAELMLLSHDA